MINVRRNITKTHQSLFTIIEVSLKDAWRAAKMQTEATAKLKKFIEELAEDYREAKINLAEDTTKMTDTMSGNLERLYERGQAAVDRLELVRPLCLSESAYANAAEQSIHKVRTAADQQVNSVDQVWCVEF